MNKIKSKWVKQDNKWKEWTAIIWTRINDELPKTKDWYIVTILPEDCEGMNNRDINIWRHNNGLHTVWFDPDSLDKWYMVNTDGTLTSLKERVTHWASRIELPHFERKEN
jgi:hypothetical protein